MLESQRSDESVYPIVRTHELCRELQNRMKMCVEERGPSVKRSLLTVKGSAACMDVDRSLVVSPRWKLTCASSALVS